MNYVLFWRDNKFIAPDEAKAAHFISLQENHDAIVQMLRQCDFMLHSYRVEKEEVFVNKDGVVEFPEQTEGMGFCVCLHLLGYLLAKEQGFQIDNQSIRCYLHENLYKALCKALIMNNYL